MQCPVCGRLNQSDINVCRFCGKVFDESLPAENITPNGQTAYEITGSIPAGHKVSYKSGIIFFSSVLIIIAVIIYICTSFFTTGIRKTVRDYSVGFYGGDFYSAYDNSAVDLQKVYQKSSAAASDPFGAFGGMFGDIFGFSNSAYSSYEDMISSYLQSFRNIQLQRAQQFGSKFKMNVDAKKIKRLKGEEANRIKSSYIKAYGDTLKDGKKGDIYSAYTIIKIKGNTEAQEITMFYIIDIDGKPYVMTTENLAPFFNG